MSQTRPRYCWLLVPSPVLGPASWGPVAVALSELGQEPVVADTTMTTVAHEDHIGPWVDEILAIERPDPELPVVVVTHSAACPRAPLLVRRLIDAGWPVSSMLLVDGRFPDGEAFTACRHYAEMLDRMVRPDDYLPPWPRWWGSLVEGLVVDEESRTLLLAESRPIPRNLFDQACPVPELPPTLGRGFLSFGPGYADARDQAFDAGWMTLRLSGDHLHQLVAPEAVAGALVGMVAGMVCGRGLPDLDPETESDPER